MCHCVLHNLFLLNRELQNNQIKDLVPAHFRGLQRVNLMYVQDTYSINYFLHCIYYQLRICMYIATYVDRI